MIAVAHSPRPSGAALWQKVRVIMDVILHIGAHRTATTAFQRYLRLNAPDLAAQGLQVWGPLRTRQKLFPGLMPAALATPRARDRAVGRIRLNCHRLARQGARQLLVSDENMMGFMRDNLCATRLYRDVGERVARLVHAFDGRVSHVVLGIRSLDSYWASVIGFSVARGVPVPGPDRLDRLVTQPRSWRDVVTDVACAAPGAALTVLPFESFAGRADAALSQMTRARVIPPAAHAADRRNETPDRAALQAILRDRARGERLRDGPARWQPFDTAQAAALRETHLDDLFWLRAGADGLATLTEDPVPHGAGRNLPGHPMTRGQENDRQERGLVQTR